MPQLKRQLTRVAVVQIAYHPAARMEGQSPLSDPIYGSSPRDSLLPESGDVSPELDERWKGLKLRMRAAYGGQLSLKLRGILQQCQAWGVHLVVFPEYSIPYDILADVAAAAKDMVVVAGSHLVERDAIRSEIYSKLSLPSGEIPNPGQAVAPILTNGGLSALVSKLNASKRELQWLRTADSWTSTPLPSGSLPYGPQELGTLICLDFLKQDERFHQLVGEQLEKCRFLAVPSLTPHYTTSEFAAKCYEQAKRYRRPVLYSDGASGGGSSIFVDEGKETDLQRFPEHVGLLPRDDEGIIVADVDLGFQRVGESTTYDYERPVVPFAAASLMYRRRPLADQCAEQVAALLELLNEESGSAVEEAVQRLESAATKTLLREASGFPGCTQQNNRMRRLFRDLDGITQAEELRRYLRDVPLAPDVLPLNDLQAALALGAREVVRKWVEEGHAPMAAVEQRLREAARRVETPDDSEWHEQSISAVQKVAKSLQEPREKTERVVRVTSPDEQRAGRVGEFHFGNWVLCVGSDEVEAYRHFQDFFYSHVQLAIHPDKLAERQGREKTPPRGAMYSQLAKLSQLARAEKRKSTSCVCVGHKGGEDEWSFSPLIFNEDSGFEGFELPASGSEKEFLDAAEELGFGNPRWRKVDDLSERLLPIRQRFSNSVAWMEVLLRQRLHLTDGKSVALKLRKSGSEESVDAIGELDAWLEES
ncbi:MAG: hypothetical protein AAF394_14215, partial [Planctomycetota bacterium]